MKSLYSDIIDKVAVIINAAHLSVWDFIQQLVKEQKCTDFVIERMIAGNNNKRQKKIYRDRNDRIFNIVSGYDKSICILEYLRGIADNLH